MFKVIAKMVTNPGKSEDFKRSVAELAPHTRDYPGCISYHLVQGRQDENVFFFVEDWDNEEAFRAHFNTEFTKEFEKKLEGVIARDVEPYECEIVV